MAHGKPGASRALEIRRDLERPYRDVYSPAAMALLAALAPLNEPRRALMSARIERRAAMDAFGKDGTRITANLDF